VPKRIHHRSDADPREGVRKYGRVKFADPTNRKYPIAQGTSRRCFTSGMCRFARCQPAC
jgi:hypothetical protein